MARQLELLDKPKARRRVLMHVRDHGSGMVQFECARCSHNTGWLGCDEDDSVTKLKRGRPCPKCNGEIRCD